MYKNVLEFNGEWRNYQEKVLEHFDEYKKDNKIHIVAAPGSGKTTVGIEYIRRLDKPALIFAPTITIREQWVKRIEEAFLVEGINKEDYISQDLKNLKAINVTTYQSLHSAMIRFQGTLSDEENQDKTENVDYHDYDLFKAIQEAGIDTLCLDECHHLRSEWWKALEEFKKKCPIQTTIALTATPPYDATLSMWNRYISMCGEIDEEITVPELVKEGSLCPHQDYVYFNYPTQEEHQELNQFKKASEETLTAYMNDPRFIEVIQTHRFLHEYVDLDEVLEKPEYLSSILIALNDHNIEYPKRYKTLLGFKSLDKMSVKWLEILLQGLLYDDTDSYYIAKDYHEFLIKDLKSKGLIEKNQVTLLFNKSLENLLVRSVGKCESIKTIVFHEYHCLKKDLKLLILTDYIRKEYEKAIGNTKMNVHNLGVLPFFEMLRREAIQNQTDLKIAVLCGSMVIIPSSSKEKLLSLVNNPEVVYFSKVGDLDENEYVKVTIKGNQHFITEAISELYAQDDIQVLIGTKSLLGEGWDSPCVNTLILASFVGSFMLSNQMRGRAIRTYANDPNKASHIWHLVCVEPKQDKYRTYSLKDSLDYQTLCRRMDNFLGLHYKEDIIENGTARLTTLPLTTKKSDINSSNKKTLKLSSQRNLLKKRWDQSLTTYDTIEVVEETEVKEKFITAILFHDAIRKYIVLTISFLLGLFIGILVFPGEHIVVYVYCSLLFGVYIFLGALFIKKYSHYVLL